MGPLDNMLSQYTQHYRQPQSVTNVPTTPSAPGRPGFDVSAPSSSFFAAAGGGLPAGFGAGPGNISAGGFSRGSSPFGAATIPDWSGVPVEKQIQIQKDLGSLTYDLASGGYRFSNKPYVNPGVHPFSDPAANRLASQDYEFIGSLPTRSVGTLALNSLPGYTPRQGPSYNSTLSNLFGSSSSAFSARLRDAGFGPTYEGPFNIPGY